MADAPIGMFWSIHAALYLLSVSKPANLQAVLDGGTGFLKVGYAAQVCFDICSKELKIHILIDLLQNFPEHQFPSIVGRPILRSEEQAGDIVVKDIMCGDEAAAARSMLQISYPVRSGSKQWRLPNCWGPETDVPGRWRMELSRNGMICNIYGITHSTRR